MVVVVIYRSADMSSTLRVWVQIQLTSKYLLNLLQKMVPMHVEIRFIFPYL